MRILVTGGAGFVGSNLALRLRELHSDWHVVALDSLRRRGAELTLPRLRAAGVSFVHGDVRVLDDVLGGERVDAVIECSAEPSVLAGVGEAPSFVVESNLVGAYHCLERARRDGAQFIFLSTSRVYPVDALAGLSLVECETRFEIAASQEVPGAGPDGISEAFPLDGARTLYGATKLAAEHLALEYGAVYGLPVTVNRCGVIAGPWQFGKVDQGVVAHWVLAHHLGRPLRYIGWQGSGKQVRDVLHVDDLAQLVLRQLEDPEHWAGETSNVGGGVASSFSLLELTKLCAAATGRVVDVERTDEERPGDIPIYVSDCSRLFARTDWRPTWDAARIVDDVARWVKENDHELIGALE